MQHKETRSIKKSLIAITATIALLVTLCTGCSGSSESADDAGLSGHWVCALVDAGNGQVVSVDEISKSGVKGADLMTLDLSDDGTAAMTSGGIDIQNGVTLSWKETIKGIEIVTSAGESIELPYDSSTGHLAMEYQGQRIIFEKE